MNAKKTLEQVKEYYGEVLQSKNDLKTSACCTAEAMPAYIRPILKEIEPEILDRFYGCGSPLPLALEGATVLDLGCGTGRDVYILSKLVGESGRVIGVDMTDEQLEVARKHIDAQTKRFGYKQPNVEFHKGYIEDLASIGLEDNSVDLVVSNCVINLSPQKERVFSEIFRVLKPGGEMYVSDVFSGRRVPEPLQQDPIVRGECLGGALYIEDFRRMLRQIGCLDFRKMSTSRIELKDTEVFKKAGMIDFYSITVRAFKLHDLEDICEDYGQIAYYQGTIPEAPHHFILDDHHIIEAGRPFPVCGNTASMLKNTRFGKHFRIVGDRSTHYGAFDCAPMSRGSDNNADSDNNAGGSCC